jgi:XTP/dITP diphosphohydrolase
MKFITNIWRVSSINPHHWRGARIPIVMTQQTLLIATNNPGKQVELEALLAGLGARLVTPAALGLAMDVAETGATYAENARLKAEALAQLSGLPTLGDDSGLEVAALNGRPGLHSARYAGPGASDADRRRKLMHELGQVPAPRPARFVAVVAVAQSGLPTREFEGVVEGEIILEERGEGGFGYDPLFFLPEYQATMAELPEATKNRLSHRGRAVEAARAYIAGLLKG